MTITRDDMFAPLIEAFPEFQERLQEFEAEWAHNWEKRPYYSLLADLVIACSELLRSKRDAELPAIFSVVERWIIEGDRYVSEAAIVGFLEDLQNSNMHRQTTPADFERFLLPQSRRWWHKLDRFWNHREPLNDD